MHIHFCVITQIKIRRYYSVCLCDTEPRKRQQHARPDPCWRQRPVRAVDRLRNSTVLRVHKYSQSFAGIAWSIIDCIFVPPEMTSSQMVCCLTCPCTRRDPTRSTRTMTGRTEQTCPSRQHCTSICVHSHPPSFTWG